jgi:hypothetical protein
MSNIIHFNSFCNDKCKNEKNVKECEKNCKIILNDFFRTIEKYNNERKMNSIYFIREFENIITN